MITGFLKNNCNDIGGVPARWAWVPLKNKETIKMMQEVTVRSINVSETVTFDHGKNQVPRSRKRSTFRTRVCTDGMVGSR